MKKTNPQPRPGNEQQMEDKPVVNNSTSVSTPKLEGKIALITGGDSGIGKAVAILFAKEGADIAISYLNEDEDAKDTQKIIEKKYSKQCLLIPGDISKERNCHKVIAKTIEKYGHIDILVNNAAIHYAAESLEEMDLSNMRQTFEVNIFSMFYITKAALPYMAKGGNIINSASVVAYRGSATLIDYSATKGAIVAFTRSLSTSLIPKGIRVNGVAPGPIWTPLIASSFDKKRLRVHGEKSPMGRPGEPVEVAPSYLFLASNDSSYITGQFLHPNGGEIING